MTNIEHFFCLEKNIRTFFLFLPKILIHNMDFYKKLLSYKAINKMSWGDIGFIINKEQATMRIAVSRKSLSELEKRELENKFSFENSQANFKSNISIEIKDLKTIKGVGDFVAENFDAVREASNYFDLTMKDKRNEDIEKYLVSRGIKVEHKKG